MRFKCEDTVESIRNMREYIDLLEVALRKYESFGYSFENGHAKRHMSARFQDAVHARTLVYEFEDRFDKRKETEDA